METVSALDLGAYDARRAAALSGVPLSTVYDWARKAVVVPSISAQREKLWSFGDLLTLRLVRWLRIGKPEAARSKMADVREALERYETELWLGDKPERGRSTLAVAADGMIVHVPRQETVHGQRVVQDGVLDLFAPYEAGVDLREPSPKLRIAPGHVGGEPHLVGTRLTTRTVAALSARGYPPRLIQELYPHDDPEALAEAISLEERLAAAA